MLVRGEQQHSQIESKRAFFALLMLMIIGLLTIFIYSSQAANVTQFTSYVSAGIVIAGASLFVGGLLGFLFGIPRTLQQSGPLKPAGVTESETAAKGNTRQVNYEANTNLEQISDWLTKILVGIGLTQLTVIPGKLQSVASYAANGLGATDASRTYALCLILFFLVCGFVLSYLWTRLYLPGEFARADKDMEALKVSHNALEVSAQAKKMSADTQANALGIGSGKSSSSGTAIAKEMFAATAEIAPGNAPGDPWKNQFGGKNVSNNRQLRAEVKKISDSSDLFSIRLTVSSIDQAKYPLQGVVQFFLHPTFKNDRPIITLDSNGVAELNLTAWGAFTIGALTDDGKTKLELDLSELPDAPTDFRNR